LTILDAIILGLIEGLTEYLPISSTGHLIIASALLGLDAPADVKHAVDAFLIVIQAGAIAAVAGVYWPRVRGMLAGLLGRDAAGLRLAMNVAVAFLPAAIVGPLLGDVIEQHLFRPGPVIAALALGGVALLVAGRWQRHMFTADAADTTRHAGDSTSRPYIEIDQLTLRQSLLIGVMQCLAMWPGTSRSMMTILGGMSVGLRPKHAAEFSFLLGGVTLTAACAYKSVKMLNDAPDHSAIIGGMDRFIVGFIVAAIAAALAVKWMIAFLNRHGLALFGWYRIALAAVLIALLATGMISFAPHSPSDSKPADGGEAALDGSSAFLAPRRGPAGRLRGELRHQIAVADRDRLADHRQERLAQADDQCPARLQVVGIIQHGLELDEATEMFDLIEVDAHDIELPELA
jgi:undecaprenyl-diphosphatase